MSFISAPIVGNLSITHRGFFKKLIMTKQQIIELAKELREEYPSLNCYEYCLHLKELVGFFGSSVSIFYDGANCILRAWPSDSKPIYIHHKKGTREKIPNSWIEAGEYIRLDCVSYTLNTLKSLMKPNLSEYEELKRIKQPKCKEKTIDNEILLVDPKDFKPIGIYPNWEQTNT